MNRPPATIPLLPLAGLCGALALAAIPLLSRTPGWAMIGLYVSLFLRVLLHWRGSRIPSLGVRLLLLAAGIGAVAATFGSFVGPEPGLSVLLVLVALKVLETKTARDLQVLALVGYFLCLCGLFFSQDMLRWLYLSGIVALITGMLLLFHRGGRPASIVPALRASALMLVQALPIALLLFFIFPRSSGGWRFQFSRPVVSQQGISDRLEPGSIASIVSSDEIVMRVEFMSGLRPPTRDLYWRAGVLWQCSGLSWSRGGPLSGERSLRQLAGPTITQRISVQPHGERWLFALDRPSTEPRGAVMQPGGFLLSSRPLFNTLHYTVDSQPENRELRLPLDHMEAALAIPANLSPAVKALAASWTTNAKSGREIVEAALTHFRRERFAYTIEPGTYGADGLDEFLFQRREGFCEHYAAAFATLMRAAGLPARVVIGYLGGDFNDVGNYHIVRQYNAHAWAEVWLSESGWVRVEPTDAIAPERIRSNAAGNLDLARSEAEELEQQRANRTWWRYAFNQATYAWDTINYRWDLHVQSYDEEQQRTLLSLLGLRDFRWSTLLIASAAVVALSVALLAVWRFRPVRRRADPLVKTWERFCRRLEAAGMARAPWEGPLDFTARAAAAWPEHAGVLRRCGELYSALRYGAAPGPARDFSAAVNALPDFPRLSLSDAPASMAAPR